MARRKVIYRKKPQNRFSMFLVCLVVLMLLVVITLRGGELKRDLAIYQEKEAALTQQIEAEKERSLELEEYSKYTQTSKYAEEVAKDKLSLVNEGEIVFKAEN